MSHTPYMRWHVPLATALLVLGAQAGSGESGPSPLPTGVEQPARAVELEWQVVSIRPHDAEAFTQGLVLDAGRLYESTGLLGRSSLRELDPVSGAVLRVRDLPADVFGEGLAHVDGRLVQLSWQNGLALVWEAETFAELGSFSYEGEGWGICFDGARLVMSDGTHTLTFRDPATFEILGTQFVTQDGEPVGRLNELECVEGEVWANVWTTDRIVRIDPTDGRVTGWLDLLGIIDPHPAATDRRAVLNGIAHDPEAGTFLVTGKLWPAMFEIRVTEPP